MWSSPKLSSCRWSHLIWTVLPAVLTTKHTFRGLGSFQASEDDTARLKEKGGSHQVDNRAVECA